MKEVKTNSGKTYSVHTAKGCTVSDDSGWSKAIAAPDGYFTAHGSTVFLSDDEATLREVFKGAPAAGGGGGSLPGDVALKSADNKFTGDNTFSGANTFSGTTTLNGDVAFADGMMSRLCGAGVHAFDWVTSYKDLELMGIDLETVTEFCYATPNLNHNKESVFPYGTEIRNLVYYNERTDGGGEIRKNRGSAPSNEGAAIFPYPNSSAKCTFIFPNATTIAKCCGGQNGAFGRQMQKLIVIAPKITNNYLTRNVYPYTFICVSAHSELSTSKLFTDSPIGGNCTIITMAFPHNVATKVDFRITKTKNVLTGFPKARNIVFSDCLLTKESVLTICGELLTYDAETMTSAPTMTLGIHIDHQTDEEVLAALNTASTAVEDGGQGWTVSVQWNGTATAATFALRPAPPLPVYAKVEINQREDGTEEQTLSWCHQISSPDGKGPEEMGYTLFESVEAARAHFNLPEPEEVPEEILTAE